MVPEKRAEIMARAAQYAHNRVVGGIHYPSDVEMGKISGSVIAAVLLNRDDFKAGYDVAKAELAPTLACKSSPAISTRGRFGRPFFMRAACSAAARQIVRWQADVGLIFDA